MSKVIKIVGLVIAVVLIGFVVFMWNWMRPIINFQESKIPRDLITSQFIDFDRIYMISKFRSGAGHDYSHGALNGETCRSMKHYFNTSKYQDPQTYRPLRSQPTELEPNIKIYSPFDGTIKSVSPEHLGVQVHIFSSKYSSFYVRLFHVDLLSEFKPGSKVKSGEWIATIGPKDGTDFSAEAITLGGGVVYLSYFETMKDEVFAPFEKMGFKREDFIISKEYRDVHPFQCGGIQTNSLNSAKETFQHSTDRNRNWTDDFVFLKPDPYPRPDQQSAPIGPPQR